MHLLDIHDGMLRVYEQISVLSLPTPKKTLFAWVRETTDSVQSGWCSVKLTVRWPMSAVTHGTVKELAAEINLRNGAL
jgi:hypothetical protein